MNTRTCYQCPNPAHGHSAYCQDCNQQIRTRLAARGRGPVPKSCSRCSACGNTFLSLEAFTSHRPDRDGCLDPATLDLVKINEIWGTPEGHQQRAVSADRMTKLQQARRQARALTQTPETGPPVSQ